MNNKMQPLSEPHGSRLASDEEPLIFSLRDRPNWRCDPMAVTFLKSAETDQSGNPRCASKRWFLTEGRPVVRGYDRVKHWQPFVARADGIEDLSQILTRAERYSDLLAVRGAIRNASAHKQNINRRCRPGRTMRDPTWRTYLVAGS